MGAFEERLKQRIDFEEALKLTPQKLGEWIAQNRNKENWDWEWELWNQFILPLQREINLLHYQPELAIPLDKDGQDENDGIPF